MMEQGLKGTIISWERIRMIQQECRDKDIEGLSVVDKYCEAQAEISKKAGIKEVVEWLKLGNIAVYRRLDSWELEFLEPLSSYPHWQAKLKSWGISA